MNVLTSQTSLKEKLESFLARACEAEAAGGYREAERLFRMALHCEGHLSPEVTNVSEYVNQAGTVYKQE
jgi:hypothetical protein